MDKNPSKMAIHIIFMAKEKTFLDEIYQSIQIFKDIGLVHHKEVYRYILLLYRPHYLHINRI